MLNRYQELSLQKAVVRFETSDQAFAEATATKLEEALETLTEYFGLQAPLPRIRAFLAHHRDAFDALVADVLRIEIERPSDPRRIAQPQRTDIVLLSPAAYGDQSAYEYVPGDFSRMIHHELVHVVEELLSPDIETSPLWWSEGLAVYLSGQWRHESQFDFREPVLEAVRNGTAPSLSSIFDDLSLAYSFGWTLVRFIEQTAGTTAIKQAVRSVDDGDVLAWLGEKPSSFENAWSDWLLRGEGSSL